MDYSGRPLLATRVDDELYVPQGAEDAILAAARANLNVLIIGAPGSGKTSMLHHIEYLVGQAEESVVYLDARRSDGLDLLLDELRRRVGVEQPTQSAFETMAMLSGSNGGAVPTAQKSLEALGAMPAGKHWLVLVDSPDRDAAHTLFGRLRDVVWQLPMSWVVAADSAASDAFRRPPADAFFDLTVRIDGLGENAAREVLARRGVAPASAKDLIAMDATTPRALLDRARRSLLERITPAEVHRSELDFHRRLGEVSRAAAMLATELRGLGPVSASDEDVQRRMGWTRSRLTQVLRELEEHGLATTTDAGDGRAGRPRRMYEIAAP